MESSAPVCDDIFAGVDKNDDLKNKNTDVKNTIDKNVDEETFDPINLEWQLKKNKKTGLWKKKCLKNDDKLAARNAFCGRLLNNEWDSRGPGF